MGNILFLRGLLSSALIGALACEAGATDCFSKQIGEITHYQCSDGRKGTSHKVGNTTIYNFGGKTGTRQDFGNFRFYRHNDKTVTSHDVGNTTVLSTGKGNATAHSQGGRTVIQGKEGTVSTREVGGIKLYNIEPAPNR